MWRSSPGPHTVHPVQFLEPARPRASAETSPTSAPASPPQADHSEAAMRRLRTPFETAAAV
ncbi:hypothetical protein ACZ91_68940 [Streptomyces regensis]|nr:hypothetical protein ACZ91_68940 [Streptomyces regensis]